MGLVETETRGGAIWIWLNRPDRHNALVPALVSQLRSAIADAAMTKPVALVLSGRGSAFDRWRYWRVLDMPDRRVHSSSATPWFRPWFRNCGAPLPMRR